MIIKGSMYLTCDPQMVSDAPYNNERIVILAENLRNSLPINPDIITFGSILLPSYNAVEAELNGDLNLFARIYSQDLMSTVQDRFIVLLLAALAKGINILLYIEKDEYYSLHFKDVLATHIYNAYGVMIGNERTKFGVDESYSPIILSKFYLYDYISSQDFLRTYPVGLDIPLDTLSKLTMEYRPYVVSPSSEAYNAYFKNFIANQHNSTEDLKVLLTRR